MMQNLFCIMKKIFALALVAVFCLAGYGVSAQTQSKNQKLSPKQEKREAQRASVRSVRLNTNAISILWLHRAIFSSYPTVCVLCRPDQTPDYQSEFRIAVLGRRIRYFPALTSRGAVMP